METSEALMKRKSVRNYDSEKPVDDRTIRSILELGIRAPSAGNLQPWKILVLRRPETRNRLAGAAFGSHFIASAPAVLVICTEPARSQSVYGRRGAELYCIQDTAALIENILLAAVDCGLGTCWVGAFDEGRCREVLSLKENLRPVAMIAIGYPADDAPRTGRRPLEEIIIWE